MLRPIEHDFRQNHRLRLMACLAASLLVVVGAVELWPAAGAAEAPPVTYITRPQEVIALEAVQPTAQGQAAPPPPIPVPPVVVPDAVVLEEDPLDLDVPFNDVPIEEPAITGTGPGTGPGTEAGTGPGTTPGAGEAVVNVQVGPKTVRFVEPEYTREARRKKIRAEVVVEVLVDETGRVQETKILERFLLGKDAADRRAVDEVGFGLEEAALSAAGRWVFRPAQHNGKPVASYTTLTFTFGV